ncbi:MAG TPA: TfuA-like protein [Polyangiaceae bacterium]|nr:TfuA-like protein [Polyangiaceae bacterium]
MSIFLFCGPSLPPETAASLLPAAHCEGPAQCGDVYRAVRRGATTIAICDGYFEHAVPVWHKEILWALSRGVRVYGAASMGALRAAELSPFGMRGVGRIFEQFRDGVLHDDDEVAIIHESPEQGYRVRSDAMVNIRATLEVATASGAIPSSFAQRLVAIAKALFYPERSFSRLLENAAREGQALAHIEALREWIATHSVVDQKGLDARALLQELRSELDEPSPMLEPRVPFVFQYTDAFHALRQHLEATERANDGSRAPDPLERQVRAEALERALALSLADMDGFEPQAEDIQLLSELFREERGLLDSEQTSAWLSARNLDVEDFSRLIYESLLVERYRADARRLAALQFDTARLLMAPVR